MSEHPLEALNVALYAIRLNALDRAELDRRLGIAADRTCDAIVATAAARDATEIVAAIAATAELALALEAASAAWQSAGDLLLTLSNAYARNALAARGELARCMHAAGAPNISARGVLIEGLEPARSVEITGAVPEAFLRPAPEREPDKAAIARELRRGATPNWARFAYGPPRVRISAKDPA